MRVTFAVGVLVAVCVFQTGASGQTDWTWYDGTLIELEYSVGTGPNTSLLIVDFQNGDYYAFEYRWDSPVEGVIDGWDMIQAVGVPSGQPNPEGRLEYLCTDWGWGVTIDAFAYDADSQTAGTEEPWPSWVYYLSDDEAKHFVDPAPFGCADRELFDGSWDGWSWHGNGWGTGGPPVPEPSVLVLASAGGLLLLRRRGN